MKPCRARRLCRPAFTALLLAAWCSGCDASPEEPVAAKNAQPAVAPAPAKAMQVAAASAEASEPRPTPPAEPKAAGDGRATHGAMAKVPVKLGYYVWEGEGSCEKPLGMIKLEADGYWELSGTPEDSFHMQFGSVEAEGNNSYFILFGGEDAVQCDEDEPCNPGIGVTRLGPDRIMITIQDSAYYRFCPPETVPARFRR